MVSFQHQMQTGDWMEDGDSVPASPNSRRPRSTSPSGERQLHLVGNQSGFTTNATTPPLKLAETTVTGVQSALNRRAMQVSRLKVAVGESIFIEINWKFSDPRYSLYD